MNPEFKDQSSPEITITAASPDDAEAIGEISAQTWLATYPNEEYGVTEDDIKSKELGGPERVKLWRATIEHRLGKSNVFIAKEGDRIIGFCSVNKGKKVNFVGALYVLPEFQGQGVGKQLLEEGLQWLGGYKDIQLDVAEYNIAAIEFYKKFGFEILGKEDPKWAKKLPSGNIIPGLEMIKRLQK